MSHVDFYRENKKYSEYLSKVDIGLYQKYLKFMSPSKSSKKVLDMGCGIGTVINELEKVNENCDFYGVDVSKTLINEAKEGSKRNKFKVYDGGRIPFKDSFFDKTGCFTVIEHVANPVELINELARVTKKNGLVIIGAPNFLRVFGLKAEHPRVKGLKRSLLNLLTIIKKFTLNFASPQKMKFDFMEATSDKVTCFADFDAICISNPIDVKFFLKKAGIQIVYQSGLVNYHKNNFINKISHLPIFRDMTGGFFIVGVKQEIDFSTKLVKK